jgi:hypothetical protein
MVSATPSDPTRRLRFLFLALTAALLALTAARPAVAQDDTRPPAIAERPAVNTATDTEADAATDPVDAGAPVKQPGETAAQRRHKTRVAEVAGLLLLILVAAGVLLVAGVIVWGARVRRLVRAPLPKPSEPDPLWYLRKKPRPPVDTTPDPSHEEDAAK